jgi:translocation and assembly module TamA
MTMRLKLCLLLTSVLIMHAAQAADPQPYTVHISATGDGALDALLKASSQLVSLRTTAPAGPFALVGRAEADIERLQTVLESAGYYRRRVSISINGQPLGDPQLPAALEALSRDTPATVQVDIETGALYHLRHVTIEGEISAQARSAFALQSGAPAVASQVLAARDRLLDALQDEGRAFATVEEPIAYRDATEPVLDVTFKVDPGKRYRIGAIHFAGLKRVREAFLRRRLLLHSGERYSPAAIERARTDLLSLRAIAGITVQAPKLSDAQGESLPITYEVQERARHAINLTAAYSSDLGGSGGATWIDRNAFGGAEQLALSASLTNWGGSDTTGLGYNLGAQLSEPDFGVRDQTLQFSLGALQQDLITYDQTAATAGMSLSRKLTAQWTLGVGLSLEQERIVQQGSHLNYTLFALPLSARYDSTGLPNPLLDPQHGIRATLSVAPTESLGEGHAVIATSSGGGQREGNATFVITQASIATYFDLARLGWTRSGRSILALRLLGADAYGAGQFSLPPDQRFYGGGSATVRGYNYQSIGPEFPAPAAPGSPTGGTELAAGSAEFRQRFGENFGAAWFVDAGGVTDGVQPFKVLHCTPRYDCGVGYGAGLRYYTPIGPIRLDLALPAKHVPGSNAIEVYVGLGQAF